MACEEPAKTDDDSVAQMAVSCQELEELHNLWTTKLWVKALNRGNLCEKILGNHRKKNIGKKHKETFQGDTKRELGENFGRTIFMQQL